MINGEVVQITEVLQRAKQGRTLPFHCRGADGRLYYVKGHDAGRRSLIAEWLASNMAAAFGLPVAEFRIVEVPEAMEYLGIPGFADLGIGFAFGSLAHENVMDLTFLNVPKVPALVRRDVAVFDWWVRNEDRTLTELGGNVNLLWDIVQQDLVVIDYNLAFDDTFNEEHFRAGHVFATDWNDVYQDFLARPAYELRMQQALRRFEEACDKMPDEWLEVGPGVPSLFKPEDAKQILDRVTQADFWNRP
jgi:hypothetical protein